MLLKGQGVVVRFVPNRLGEFYSLLSRGRKELVDRCILRSFFKCKQVGMSEVLKEFLSDCYQHTDVFKLNNVDVLFGPKDKSLF